MLTMQDIRDRPVLYAAAKAYRLLFAEGLEVHLIAEYLLLREIKAAFPEDEWELKIDSGAECIDAMFHWAGSKQGHEYWANLHYIAEVLTGERPESHLKQIKV